MLLLPVAPVSQSAASPPIPLAWREGELCVSLSLMGGKPSWFLLDTGCMRSCLTRRAYARLQEAGAEVREDGTLVAKGATIGEFAVPPLEFGHESDQFRFSVEGTADGCLGMDFLSKYKVGIDLREKTLRLWPADVEPEAAVREWFTTVELWTVPVVRRPEGYAAPVEVGNLTVPMVIDTGSPYTFVHTDVAALLRGATRQRGFERIAFYNGHAQVRSYSVRSVGLGGASLGRRTVKAAGVDRMLGLLGRDVLAPLKALIDYPGEKAYFAGAPADDAEPPPLYDGPTVTLLSGVVVRWPRGVVVRVPPGATFSPVSGYTAVYKEDLSVDLLPSKGAGKARETGVSVGGRLATVDRTPH